MLVKGSRVVRRIGGVTRILRLLGHRFRGFMCIWIWERDEMGCVVWLVGCFLDVRRKKRGDESEVWIGCIL